MTPENAKLLLDMIFNRSNPIPSDEAIDAAIQDIDLEYDLTYNSGTFVKTKKCTFFKHMLDAPKASANELKKKEILSALFKKSFSVYKQPDTVVPFSNFELAIECYFFHDLNLKEMFEGKNINYSKMSPHLRMKLLEMALSNETSELFDLLSQNGFSLVDFYYTRGLTQNNIGLFSSIIFKRILGEISKGNSTFKENRFLALLKKEEPYVLKKILSGSYEQESFLKNAVLALRGSDFLEFLLKYEGIEALEKKCSEGNLLTRIGYIMKSKETDANKFQKAKIVFDFLMKNATSAYKAEAREDLEDVVPGFEIEGQELTDEIPVGKQTSMQENFESSKDDIKPLETIISSDSREQLASLEVKLDNPSIPVVNSKQVSQLQTPLVTPVPETKHELSMNSRSAKILLDVIHSSSEHMPSDDEIYAAVEGIDFRSDISYSGVPGTGSSAPFLSYLYPKENDRVYSEGGNKFEPIIIERKRSKEKNKIISAVLKKLFSDLSDPRRTYVRYKDEQNIASAIKLSIEYDIDITGLISNKLIIFENTKFNDDGRSAFKQVFFGSRYDALLDFFIKKRFSLVDIFHDKKAYFWHVITDKKNNFIVERRLVTLLKKEDPESLKDILSVSSDKPSPLTEAVLNFKHLTLIRFLFDIEGVGRMEQYSPNLLWTIGHAAMNSGSAESTQARTIFDFLLEKFTPEYKKKFLKEISECKKNSTEKSSVPDDLRKQLSKLEEEIESSINKNAEVDFTGSNPGPRVDLNKPGPNNPPPPGGGGDGNDGDGNDGDGNDGDGNDGDGDEKDPKKQAKKSAPSTHRFWNIVLSILTGLLVIPAIVILVHYAMRSRNKSGKLQASGKSTSTPPSFTEFYEQDACNLCRHPLQFFTKEAKSTSKGSSKGKSSSNSARPY